MKHRLLLLLFVLCTTAFAALAHTGPGTEMTSTEGTTLTKKNDIAGGVIQAETKKPLMNVNVSAYSANKKEGSAITDDNGYYYFNDLKPGTYRLVFEKDGYKRVTREKVLIRSDEGCQLNVAMDEVDEFQIMPGLFHFN
ncbi:MAG: carboxypeptidase-like regulatory domain-containing protein [Flavisolibacter sp.]